MVNYMALHNAPKKNIRVLLKSIPTAETPDSRWGLFQIGLSFFFFFFGLAIAAIQFSDTPLWGCTLMIVAIVLSVMAFSVIVGTIALGLYFWFKKEKDYPILIVTKNSALQINPDNIKLETNNGIKITTDKYNIEIRSLKIEGGSNGESK